MARTSLEVIVTVRDGASKPLQRVQNNLRGTGKAAKEVTADLWQFNKTIFSGIAFLNLFTKAFGAIRSSMDLGAPLDRVTTQFEKVFGPRGDFLAALRGSTNSVVDEFAAVETALHLGQLGITKSSGTAADMISKMAVAARMAGKDTTEGVKDLTQAVLDGNIAKLQEYGIMRKYDPAYMALIASMNKAGGIYGATIVKQQQLAIVMSKLTEHTRDHMFMFMSTGEVVSALGKKFVDLRQHIGVLLSTAFRPLMEKLIPFLDKLSDTLFTIYRTDKQILFLVKSVIALGGALSGLLATVGSLKLAVKLLGFARVGLPGLSAAVLTLGAALVGLTKDADGVLEKFRVIGAVFKGVYELVTNLDPETGMSKISKSTKDLLEKYGLLGFTQTIARIVSVIKTVVQDIYRVFTVTAKFVDKVFGGMFETFKNIISSFTSTWTTWWTSDAITPIEKFVRATTAILAPLLTFFAFKGLKGVLSKIPLVGRLFGGGGGRGEGPLGTPSDPLYVVGPGGIGGLPGEAAKGIFDKLIPQGIGQKVKDWLVADLKKGKIYEALNKTSGLFGRTVGRWLAGQLAGLSMAFDLLMSSMSRMLSSAFAVIAPFLGPAVAVGAGALIGYAIGKAVNSLLDSYTQGKTKEGFEGNVVERGMFRLFGSAEDKKRLSEFEKFKATSDVDLINEIRKKQGKEPLTPEQEARVNNRGSRQTEIAAPEMPDDLAIAASLTEQMQTMSAGKAAELKTALEQALATKEANGRFISPEEYTSLQDIFTKAIDNSENIKTMATNSKPGIQQKTPNRPY